MSLNQTPLLFYAVLLLAPIGTGTWIAFEHFKVQKEMKEYAFALNRSSSALQKKMRKERFLQRYTDADPCFLERQITTLKVLEQEAEKLQSLLQHPALAAKQIYAERLRKIKANRFHFIQQDVRVSGQIRETEEKQRDAVQVDRKDLQNLCARIEDIQVGPVGPRIGAPQLIFTDFRMKKSQNPLSLEIYDVQTEVLKREWGHS